MSFQKNNNNMGRKDLAKKVTLTRPQSEPRKFEASKKLEKVRKVPTVVVG